MTLSARSLCYQITELDRTQCTLPNTTKHHVSTVKCASCFQVKTLSEVFEQGIHHYWNGSYHHHHPFQGFAYQSHPLVVWLSDCPRLKCLWWTLTEKATASKLRWAFCFGQCLTYIFYIFTFSLLPLISCLLFFLLSFHFFVSCFFLFHLFFTLFHVTVHFFLIGIMTFLREMAKRVNFGDMGAASVWSEGGGVSGRDCFFKTKSFQVLRHF